MSVNIERLEEIDSLGPNALGRLVYVVGTARGGTSVLQSAIGIHDQILALPGPSHFLNQVWRYRRRVHARLLRQIFRLPSFYREAEIIQSLGKEEGRFLRRYINSCLASGNLRLMWQLYPIVYALDEENKKTSQEVKCWLDKAGNCYKLRIIPRYFPHAKFIFILRDPRGAVASLAKRATAKSTGSYEGGIDYEKLVTSCIYWRYTMLRIQRFSRRNAKACLKVKFEDFLLSPEATLDRIFRFAVGDSLPKEAMKERLSQVPYGATNYPSERGKGISTRPLDRWKTFLSNTDVDLIAEITGPTARKLGYNIGFTEHKRGLFRIIMGIAGTKRRLIVALRLFCLSVREKSV